MIYRFKSVPLVSCENRKSADPDGQATVSACDLADVRAHTLDLSHDEFTTGPRRVALVVFAVVFTMGILVQTGFKPGMASLWAALTDSWRAVSLALLAAGAAFGFSLRIERNFRCVLKALEDRNCGWLNIRTFNARDLASAMPHLKHPVISNAPIWVYGHTARLGEAAHLLHMAPKEATTQKR